MSANAEHGGTKDDGRENGGGSSDEKPERQSLEIGQARIALDDGGGVAADAEEDDVAEGVVTHAPAQHVPGEREDDHEPEKGDLRREARQKQRPGDTGKRERAHDVPIGDAAHSR